MNNNDTNYEDPLVTKIKYKNILIIILILIYVIIKIYYNKINIKDFFNFKPISLSLERIDEIKEYLLFFAIIIPISYFLWKSNLKWAQEQIALMEENEEKKKKIKEQKRQEEFETKMRGIHFKDD